MCAQDYLFKCAAGLLQLVTIVLSLSNVVLLSKRPFHHIPKEASGAVGVGSLDAESAERGNLALVVGPGRVKLKV